MVSLGVLFVRWLPSFVSFIYEISKIFFQSATIPKAPEYSVTCDSIEAEIIYANVEEI
jgi:hypothetical protein